MMIEHPLAIAAIVITLHFWSLLLLSFCSTNGKTNGKTRVAILQNATIASGLATGLLTVSLPYVLAINNPLANCVLRILCFFFGCKILDLAVARARTPPALLSNGQPVTLDLMSERIRYIWLLFTETRYAGFDIAIQQKERLSPASSAWTFGPALVIPIIVYLVPTPETKSLMALLLIQLGLETVHAICHPTCPNYLFWKPFAASSLTSFWRTHWHGGAETFLRSLGYAPGRDLTLQLGSNKQIARAVGVVGAFNLTGIWHGYATAALATRPWMVGLRVWGLFVAMGISIVLEASLPKGWRGSVLNRLFVWTFFIIWAGWAWRGLQSNCKVQWLADL